MPTPPLQVHTSQNLTKISITHSALKNIDDIFLQNFPNISLLNFSNNEI